MPGDFESVAAALAATSRNLHARGWVPATSGNFSARLSGGDIAITASGRDKGALSATDILRLAPDGAVPGSGQPSAETGLHLQLYARDPAIGAVLHTHSLQATLATSATRDHLAFTGLELTKAFPGIDSHEQTFNLPVYDNDQDIAALASAVEKRMAHEGQGHAYLIRGHGLYTWGANVKQCVMQLEALEYLLEYDWKMNRRQEAKAP